MKSIIIFPDASRSEIAIFLVINKKIIIKNKGSSWKRDEVRIQRNKARTTSTHNTSPGRRLLHIKIVVILTAPRVCWSRVARAAYTRIRIIHSYFQVTSSTAADRI
uniref:Uncharacterized protein n=1 Tax=Trichogramma kaykai TaxID=54128 RepID=A0ABD2XDW0_9HYME